MAASPDRGEQYVSVGGHRLRLTSLDKVMYPETGTTKAEVIDYYSRVAETLIPHAKNRPATRKRWVSGVGTAEKPGQVFFEKNLPDSAPGWLPRRDIQHKDHTNTYPLVNDLATLVWIAQQNALEIHVPQWRFGRNGARRNPDRLVLDLDPGEGAGLPECVEVAKLVRELLQDVGLETFPVTSGSKGIHLYAALDGSRSSDTVSAFAHELARALEADHPDLVVSDQRKTDRVGRVLLDWSQNNGSKTTIVPYSLRGRLRPTVAAPRTWRELLHPGLRQLEFGEVLDRLARKGDPLAELSASHLGEVDERLAPYRSMRVAARTPEPMGDGEADPAAGAPMFVIQEHHATRLHHDFRLEHDGVLVSWALPKGLPTDPGVNHLAVQTEDHPLEYGSFEGTIPRGEYGAGTVTIWDTGTYELEKWRDGQEVIVTIHGRAHGSHRLALIRTGDEGGKARWLIHLMKDQTPHPEHAEEPYRRPVTTSPGRGLRRGKTIVGSRKRTDIVHPMLATAAEPDELRGREGWRFEMKWDGFRAIARLSGDETTFTSRNGLDLTPTFPELAVLAEAVRGDAVIDGEIVAPDEHGVPRFARIQRRAGLTAPRDVDRARRAVSVEYYAFDLLEEDGRPLTGLPYAERRARLEALVRPGALVRVPPDAGDDVDAALATSRELGLEGVVAKRVDSPYRLGRRSRDWLKIRHTLAQEVVVGGWRTGNGVRADTIGSLLVGIPDAEGLRYAGRVGTGFDERELDRIRARLDGLAIEGCPLLGVPAADAGDAHWVTPALVGEVEHGGFTPDGRLRHPVWRGWRLDKSPAEVRRERTME